MLGPFLLALICGALVLPIFGQLGALAVALVVAWHARPYGQK